jgi:4-amino-4-deoxy-L-arabinose transferase-like glycosyltransferase
MGSRLTVDTAIHDSMADTADRSLPAGAADASASAARWRQRARDVLRRSPRAVEIALVVAIIVIAGVLRVHDLGSNPPGLHGDEAVSGLEGRRILAEGWIGPYSPLALGQPTGPLYLTALSLRLFGDSVQAVRIVSALLGVLTVVALYALLRRAVDAPTALAGAGLLAVMGWHLHFSRIAFPVIAWPLAVVLAAAAMQEADRRDDPRWWAAAGALAGLGIYAYNAHPLLLVPLFGLALFWLGRREARPVDATPTGSSLAGLLAFVSALALTVLPMVLFAADEANGYFQHLQSNSVFNQPAWTAAATIGERIGLLLGRYLGFWDRLCCHPQVDGSDGTGVVPLVPLPFLLLSATGVALALRARSGLWAVFAALVVAVVPLGAAITEGGLARRTFAIAPFLAAFAGYGVVQLWRLGAARGPAVRLLATAALVLVSGAAVWQSLDGELRVFPRSQEAVWVFGREMADASAFMSCLGQRHHVYFFSDRWSVHYETRLFLAPDIAAEDRSREFGPAASGDRSADLGESDLEVDPQAGAPVFMLLGSYQDLFSEIRRRYPGGESRRGHRAGADEAPTFIAYFAPRLTAEGAAKPSPPSVPEACREFK